MYVSPLSLLYFLHAIMCISTDVSASYCMLDEGMHIIKSMKAKVWYSSNVLIMTLTQWDQ